MSRMMIWKVRETDVFIYILGDTLSLFIKTFFAHKIIYIRSRSIRGATFKLNFILGIATVSYSSTQSQEAFSVNKPKQDFWPEV